MDLLPMYGKKPYEIINYRDPATSMTTPQTLEFNLVLDFDKEVKMVKDDWFDAFYSPTEKTYHIFGKDSAVVKNEYEKAIIDMIDKVQLKRSVDYYLLYYEDGLTITADTDFCGITAGHNLFPQFIQMCVDARSLPDSSLSIIVPENYTPLAQKLRFVLSLKGREIADGKSNIHLEIPVKAGLFLNFLLERRSNPDAQLQFRDEVLTADFTIDKMIK